MLAAFAKTVAVAAWFGTTLHVDSASGQEAAAALPNTAAPADEVIVRGSIAELRRQIVIAEEAIYARFNEINSDDRFDIHCRLQPRLGSRVEERFCLSNSWREQDRNYGQAFVRMLQGEAGAHPQQFRAEQLLMQSRLIDEMRRLATEDEELLAAVHRLANAQVALSGRTRKSSGWTVSRQVRPADGPLPFGAQRMFEVEVGRAPWAHRLSERTFAIAHVFGEVRDLELDCDRGSKRLEYQHGVEWSLPDGWNTCMLLVEAKRDTTFVLYEFN
jgi:hypothetical protein